MLVLTIHTDNITASRFFRDAQSQDEAAANVKAYEADFDTGVQSRGLRARRKFKTSKSKYCS